MNSYLVRVGEFILAQSWQIASLFLLVAFAALLLRNKSAHLRYLLWLIVLAKCLVPPFYGIPLRVLPPAVPHGESYGVPFGDVRGVMESNQTADSTLTLSNTPASEASAAVRAESEPTGMRQAPVSRVGMLTWARMRHRVGLAWLAGVSLYLAFNVLRALRTHRWLRRARQPLPVAAREALTAFFSAHGFGRLPKIWLADDVTQPFVWGLVRGSIYLPSNFLDVNDPARQHNTLAHELSHTARFDAAVNVLQVIAQGLFWFHPFVWWANTQIRREREKCCDEMAVASLGTRPEEYGMAVLETLIRPRESTHPVPSLAIAGPARNLEGRIRTMMTPGKKFHKHPSLIAVTISVLVALMVVPIALVLTSCAQTESPAEPYAEWEQKPAPSLADAALAGDLDEVKRLLADGVDVNTTAPDIMSVKFTPLMAAANRGHAEVAKVLLENGAEVNATDFQGWTALYYAFWIFPDEDNEQKHKERAELVRALIAAGIDVNKQNQGISPLINAITTGTPRLGSIEALLDAGADLHFKDNRGLTPLYYAAFHGNRDVLDLILERAYDADTIHLAACRGDVDRVRNLLEEGTDVNAKDEFGCTPLHWAARARSPEVARLLIANGANVDATAGPDELTPLMAADQLPIIEVLVSAGADLRSQQNLTKLHDACSSGDIEVVQFLIDKGADIDARNGQRATPLLEAAAWGHTEIVELLLEEGANINARRRGGATPLWIAVRLGNKETVELLLEKGANVNTPDNAGVTPLGRARQGGETDIAEILREHGAEESLHGAAAAGDIDSVKMLIDRGADTNARDDRGWTPLHSAARSRKDVVELLLSRGADANAKNNNGLTPLHLAARDGQEDIVELLVAKGADVNATDNGGRTPLDLAADRGHAVIVELLKKHGAAEPKESPDSLEAAIMSNDLEKLKELIAQGANVNAPDSRGNPPLLLAARRGQLAFVEALIAAGADVNLKNARDRRPLGVAIQRGRTEVAELLRQHGAEE